MDINCDLMVKKWEQLAETILQSDCVYVMEGCLYQSIIRYFKRHPFTGEESVYKMWEHYQAVSDIQFNRYNGWEIKIDTTGGDWVSHLKNIMSLIGLPYIDEKSSWIPESLDYFTEIYSVNLRGQTQSIQVFHENSQLYCKAFWPYMALKPIGKGIFEMASFPIEFHFKQLNGQMAISVTGNYDWKIVGETLIRI